MNELIQLYIDMVNQYINNYAIDAFAYSRLKTILLLGAQIMVGIQGGSVTNGGGAPLMVGSANFSNATDCPLTALNGLSLQLFANDLNKYLILGTDWNPLSGGGFTILIPGFDSTAQNFTFFVFS